MGILSYVCLGSSLTHNSLQQDPGSRQLCRCQGETGLPAWEQPQLESNMLSCSAELGLSTATQVPNASVASWRAEPKIRVAVQPGSWREESSWLPRRGGPNFLWTLLANTSFKQAQTLGSCRDPMKANRAGPRVPGRIELGNDWCMAREEHQPLPAAELGMKNGHG